MKAKRPEKHVGGPFQPGNRLASGNGGKRHSRFITQHLISYLNETIASPSAKTADEKKRYAERVHWLVAKMVEMAMDGDSTCMRMIMDRVEGTPIQTVNFRESKDDVEVPMEYTREHLAKLSPNELSKLYTQQLLADSDDQRPN